MMIKHETVPIVHCSLKSSCSSRNSFSFLFPPTFIFSNSEGFHLSIVADRTKLKWTPFRVQIRINWFNLIFKTKIRKKNNLFFELSCNTGYVTATRFQATSKHLFYREDYHVNVFRGHEIGTECSRTRPRPRCLPEHCRQIQIP